MGKYVAEEHWVETFALFFLVLGFIVSVLISSTTLSYVSIIFSGFIAGRIFFIKRFSEPILPFVLIISGFLLGYLIGGSRVSRGWALLLFLVASYGTYLLYMKKILVIFKSEKYVK